MLNMVIRYLPILGIVGVINIILGMYNNIGVKFEKFTWCRLFSGIIKIVIVAISFIALAYCFDVTGMIINVGAFELTPDLIMTTSIAIYMVKDTSTLAKILGITKSKKIESIENIEDEYTDDIDKENINMLDIDKMNINEGEG